MAHEIALRRELATVSEQIRAAWEVIPNLKNPDVRRLAAFKYLASRPVGEVSDLKHCIGKSTIDGWDEQTHALAAELLPSEPIVDPRYLREQWDAASDWIADVVDRADDESPEVQTALRSAAEGWPLVEPAEFVLAGRAIDRGKDEGPAPQLVEDYPGWTRVFRPETIEEIETRRHFEETCRNGNFLLHLTRVWKIVESSELRQELRTLVQKLLPTIQSRKDRELYAIILARATQIDAEDSQPA